MLLVDVVLIVHISIPIVQAIGEHVLAPVLAHALRLLKRAFVEVWLLCSARAGVLFAFIILSALGLSHPVHGLQELNVENGTPLAPPLNSSCQPLDLRQVHIKEELILQFINPNRDPSVPVVLGVKLLTIKNGFATYKEAFFLEGDETARDAIAKSNNRVKKSIFGVFSKSRKMAPLRGDYRIRSYAADWVELLAGMQPGEAHTVKTTERSRFKGNASSIYTPIEITFKGCESFVLDQKVFPVAVYDIEITSRSYNMHTGDDKPLTTKKKVYVSRDFGFWFPFFVTGDENGCFDTLNL